MEDAARVDPKHYTVELENDQVRVLRIVYGPREKSVMHGHPRSLAIFLSDQHARFTFPDGSTEEIQAQAGQVKEFPQGDHLPENLADKPMEVILVEFKGQA